LLCQNHLFLNFIFLRKFSLVSGGFMPRCLLMSQSPEILSAPLEDRAGDLANVADASTALTGELVTAIGSDLPEVSNGAGSIKKDRSQYLSTSSTTESSSLGWLQNKWVWAVAALGILAIPGTLYGSKLIEQSQVKPVVVVTPPPKITSVAALGRLEPDGEVIKLTASSSQTVLVRQILVKEGDKVVPNQVIAVLDNISTKQAQLLKAKEDIRVAQAALDKVKAGAKVGELSAQQAEVTRLQQDLRGEVNTSKATLVRLQQQLLWDTTAQARRVEELEQELLKGEASYQAEVSRLTAVEENAISEYQRYAPLQKQGVITASFLDTKQLAVVTARRELEKAKGTRAQTVSVLEKQIASNKATQTRITSTLTQQVKEAKATYDRTVATLNEQIKQAQANVARIAEVRPVDIRSAEAEVSRSVATARQAQADLELAYVRAPIAGEIFKIHTKPGEAPGNKGIVEIAQNDNMMAIAEIYESDISKIKVGQTAEITSETGSFKGTLKGTVTQVGLQVAKKDVLNTDPAADADSRVVEVKLAIEPTDTVNIRGLTNSKIQIKINTQ
jgi:HlyD family secretion protein